MMKQSTRPSLNTENLWPLQTLQRQPWMEHLSSKEAFRRQHVAMLSVRFWKPNRLIDQIHRCFKLQIFRAISTQDFLKKPFSFTWTSIPLKEKLWKNHHRQKKNKGSPYARQSNYLFWLEKIASHAQPLKLSHLVHQPKL